MASAFTHRGDVEAGRSETQRLLGGSAASASSPAAAVGVAVGRTREITLLASGDASVSSRHGGGGRVSAGTALLTALIGCALLVAGTLALTRGGDRRSIRSDLGLGDTGFGRTLTPEEATQKEKTEGEASEATVHAIDAFIATHGDQNLGLATPELGADHTAAVAHWIGYSSSAPHSQPAMTAADSHWSAGSPGQSEGGAAWVNEPRVESGRHNLTAVAAKLGSWGDCPRAFTAPKVGQNEAWTASYVAALDLAEHLYILCVDCDSITVPAPLAAKTSLVNGRVFDVCDMADEYGLDHYKRASLTHAAAVADALVKGYNHVAVVEEDSVSPVEYKLELSTDDLAGFASALQTEDWSFLRLGWRSYSLEIAPASDCPAECTCEKRAQNLCYVATGGCDLRSSDSYIISSRYMQWMLNALIQGGTVDYNVLPMAPGMLLVLPIMSVQRHLDIPAEHQSAVSDLFARKCAVEAAAT
uniref:Uncharacterized protein n=1 Tax=Mantoniella antarctica TaxID=81844 RepID=A0A7S0S6H7_9CHLO|mmetsp:Transcript_11197/g.27307  ORF Transcript_11197/g.27307 Transcript_11197/m.27307 type:complete len:473 (+) Transcript_11197:44-1462(+)